MLATSWILFFSLFLVEDLERHDGSAEKPYFMSKSLKSIIGKRNAAADWSVWEITKQLLYIELLYGV